MKRVHLLRMLLAAATVLFISAGSALAQGTVSFDGGDTHDWGVVQPGKLHTTMIIKNVGKGDLTINEVHPTCGCTSVQSQKSLLKPGDTAQVQVTMNASGVGAVHKLITVRTSDQEKPVTNYYLVADVRPTMTFMPMNYFLVNNATVGQEYLATISLVNHSDKPFTVDPLKLDHSNATVRFERTDAETVAPGATLELKAFITPTAAGAVNGVVKLHTSAEGYTDQDLHIWGSANVAQPANASAGTGTKSH